MDIFSSYLRHISKTLKDNFNYPVYLDEVKTNGEKPAFFVEIINMEKLQAIMGYDVPIPVQISLINDTLDYEELIAIGGKLDGLFRFFESKGLEDCYDISSMSQNLSYRVMGENLIVEIDYFNVINYVIEAPNMQKLKSTIRIE